MALKTLSIMALAVVMSGCGNLDEEKVQAERTDNPSGWREISQESLTPGQQDQLQRAVTAQQEMAQTMMGELRSELETGGPVGAVTVCLEMAPMIAEHISDDHGLAIGRTSHRLRNSANIAPHWATDAVAELRQGQITYQGPGGELGVLLPIKLAAPCLACHGPVESMDERLRQAVAESYPDDRATGFAEGDLRGWFWVEVPQS